MIYYRDSYGGVHSFMGDGPYQLPDGASSISPEEYERVTMATTSQRAEELAEARLAAAPQEYRRLIALGIDEETARGQSGYEEKKK